MESALSLLHRLTAHWRSRTGSETTSPDTPSTLDPRLHACADKLCSAENAVAAVRPGDRVFVGTACATPRTLVAALEARQPAPADVELLHFLTDGAVPHDAEGQVRSQYRHRSLFVGEDMRAAMRQCQADYVPISLARVPQLIKIGRIRVDVAFIQVSLPDAFGYVSLGLSVDIIPAAVAQARWVIAEVNPHMPRTLGDSLLHVGDIDQLVPVDTPLIEYQHPAQPGPVAERIGRYIASIIDDGATIQIGMGRFTHAAMQHLVDRQDLGIHSDVITDAIVPLLERGILTGRRKSHQAGKIVTSFAMGTQRLYRLLDGNPLFSFQAVDQVCDAATIARQHRMVSVTQAFAIDLSGQACVDQYQGELYGGVATQLEFLQGAARSEGGKAVLCLASTDQKDGSSRIRAVLNAGEAVGVTRSEVHYVITEYGIAYLFGRSLRERAVALVQIAHPDHRSALLDQAKALGLIPAEQQLRHLGAYAVEQESQVRLKDGRALLVRPAGAADGDAVRALFHGMSDRDVYTRFFRRVRGLSLVDVQRLCNLNGETEVALVAVTGPREAPEVVAHALYVLDPATNLAETAFIVHPAWQGLGLGHLMQQQLAQLARQAGIRGFVAEILPTNEAMIRLARQASDKVSSEHHEGTVRVTTLF